MSQAAHTCRHPGVWSALGLALCQLLTVPSGVAAQEVDIASGRVAGLGVVPALGGTSVGGECNWDPGIAGYVYVGGQGRRFQVVLDLSFQPFTVQNPVREEAFRVLYTLPSIRYVRNGTFLLAGAGMGFYWWSGNDPWVDFETGLAMALGIGKLEGPMGLETALHLNLGAVPELLSQMVSLRVGKRL